MRYPFGYRKNYNTLIFNIIKNNLKKRGEVRKMDPLETKNLAQEQSHQKILRKLRHKFTQKVQQLRDEQLVEESSSQENIKF